MRAAAASGATRRGIERRSTNQHDRVSFRRGGSSSWKPKYSPLCCAFCILFTASISLISTSVYFFFLARSKVREQLIDGYKAAIDTWAHLRPRFATLNVSMTRVDKAAAVLKHDDSKDKMRDYEEKLGFEQLPSYRHLVHRAKAPKHFVTVDDIRFEDQPLDGSGHALKTPNAIFEVAIANLGGAGGETRLAIGSYPLLQVQAQATHELYPSESSCQPKGTFSNGRCWVLMRLERLCVQIDEAIVQSVEGAATAGSSWHLKPRVPGFNESYGCEYADGRWEVPVYSEHPWGGDAAADTLAMSAPGPDEAFLVPQWSAATALARLATEGLTMEVRSHADPYLGALELTDGTLDFGMAASKEQERSQILFVLGLILALPPFAALCLRRLASRWDNAEKDVRESVGWPTGRPERSFDEEEALRQHGVIGRRYADLDNDT